MSDCGGDGGGDCGGDGGWDGGGGGRCDDHHNDYHDGHRRRGVGRGRNKKMHPMCAAIVSIACFIPGLVLLVISLVRELTWTSTIGTIVGSEYCKEGGERAIIEFEMKETTYRVRQLGCSDPGPIVGNTIKILFDPEDPTNAVDASFLGSYLFPTVLLGFCLFFAVYACCNWSKWSKKKQQQSKDAVTAQLPATQPVSSHGQEGGTVGARWGLRGTFGAATSAHVEHTHRHSPPAPSAPSATAVPLPVPVPVARVPDPYYTSPNANDIENANKPTGGEGEAAASYFDEMMGDIKQSNEQKYNA